MLHACLLDTEWDDVLENPDDDTGKSVNSIEPPLIECIPAPSEPDDDNADQLRLFNSMPILLTAVGHMHV